MAEMPVKDSNQLVHNVDVDNLASSVDVQVVKIRTGGTGIDGGLATNDNPFPVLTIDSWIMRLITRVLTRLSFDSTSQLRVTFTSGTLTSIGTVTTVTGCTTVATVTTANTSLGDMGKGGTAMLMSQMNYNSGTRRNIVRT